MNKDEDTILASPVSPQLLEKFSAFVAEHMCLYFPKDRWPELLRGARAASTAFGYEKVDECMRWLLKAPLSPDQIDVLAGQLTVGETYFFRGKVKFDALASEVLPELVRRHEKTDRRLRIWSAGCCTGEEAYSLAILVNRAIADLKDWHVTILATDINRRFLRKAEAGVYGAWSFRDPPQGLKESYFIAKSDGHYEIAQHIRRMVTFLPLNLAADVYPSLLNDTNAMDLIVCRNVLMYFTPEKTRSVVEKFRHCLVEGGWLTVSVNENAPEFFDTFETVMVGGSTFYRRPGATAGRPVETQRAGAEPAAVEKSERDPASVLAEARALYELGHYSDVPAVLSQEPVDPMAMELMARSFANAGKLDEALAWCDRTIAAAHLNPTGHFLRASILHEQGNLDEAAQAYQRALYLNPDFELAHFALGNLNSERGSHEAARRHFRHALRVLRAQKDDHILAESEGVTAGRLADIIASLLQMEAPHER